MAVDAVIFDVGNVLYSWSPRFLYERLIADDQALDAFLNEVVTFEWHEQHDHGRDFAETSAELITRYPEHEALILAWKPRFNESIGPCLPGMAALVSALAAARVPLYAITNFSHEFWPPFRAAEADLFDHFRDIVVSGEEKLAKPDPEIFRRAIPRFGIEPTRALFIDDRLDNVQSARSVGLKAHHFQDADRLREELVDMGLLSS